MLELPSSFGSYHQGQRIHVVADLKCWDPCHECHRFRACHNGIDFVATGLLGGEGERFSLINAEFRRQFPIPCLGIDEHTTVMKHQIPSWDSLFQVIELCAGFGGVAQGLSTSGFHTVLAVDSNPKMTQLYQLQSNAEVITGDVNDVSTLLKIWDVAMGANTIAAGYACQPFSRLGDQRGGEDQRALCLKGILAVAYYMQAQAIVLECVQPAAQHSYVVGELNRFLEMTGFQCSQCDLHLSDVWPCRRSRAWWLITSPLLGKIPVFPWPRMHAVTKVRQLIPKIQPWDLSDEKALTLLPVELAAFGANDDTFHRYLLNFEAHAPCALHSWGSQLLACECGCRLNGLSEHRLRDKGLFGCLVRSCETDFHSSTLRHLHPNEVMHLCAFDPLVDFGPNPRLTLAAAGQMASPLQAAWVFAHLDERIQQLQGLPVPFNAEAKTQAFMAWLIMRGKQVWPSEEAFIDDSRFLSLVRFWQEVGHLSIHELMHPPRWPELPPQGINIATILDLLICRAQNAGENPRPLPGDVPMTIIDDETNEDAPTPWYETTECEIHEMPSAIPDVCQVVFYHEFSNPIHVNVTEGGTIQSFLDAHAQLVGGLQATYACDGAGNTVPFTHVLSPGQVICIRCDEGFSPASPCEMLEVDREPAEPVVDPCVSLSAPNALKMPAVSTISPTAEWTMPAIESHEVPMFGPFDAGECSMPVQPLPDCDSWISAAPLLGLQDNQFLALHVPVVTGTKHLWSLRHQLLKAEDRVKILGNQQGIWSDDEFRYHISMLLQLRNERACLDKTFEFKNFFMLDPLLLSGWAHHGHQLCDAWAKSHPEIAQEKMTILSACMIEGHWIPVVLAPNGSHLLFTTWDAPQNSHDALNHVVDSLSKALGFASVVNLRHQRMFFTSNKCGALALAFLHHCVLGSMLPTCKEEAEVIHDGFRAAFLQTVQGCQLARRPWIWGSGDADNDWFTNEPGASSNEPGIVSIGTDSRGTCPSHQCIDKEQRMNLLREKGKMWGDDEIRFHLTHMINHSSNVCNKPFANIPGFVMMDPLMLCTWDTIGKGLCEAWCRRHQVVPEQGYHVVTVLLHEEHWFPVWFVPHGRTLVAHLIDDGVIEPSVVQPMLDVLQQQFDFLDAVLHVFPRGLPDHSMCGAAAIAFLGHIIVAADLPGDVEALADFHANMKASFVQAVYNGKCCICPVAWGSGGTGALVKSLSAELAKHGVPETMLEQRSQQAIKAIGSEQIMQALTAKNVWRSLKVLGNNVRFQFLLPEGLAEVAANNKNMPVGKRMRALAPKAKPPLPEVVDPSKLSLPEGVFQANGCTIPQLSAKQIGPLACGVALVTLDEALPYLKAGKQVSSEPLALAVFTPPGLVLDTALPHTKVLMPCVCIANSEPILTEAFVVQLGQGFVEKQVMSKAISLDQLDVVTVKVMVYRDEFPGDWGEFSASPIKQLVRIFPILKRCEVEACECPCWHNVDQLPSREPIMDVWRRQYLTSGFKQAASTKAEIFSVCLRVPAMILLTLLAQSGASGAFTEPRTPDGREVLSQYVVIWTSKLTPSEIAHVMQTNPLIIGMARLGARRGLRVHEDHAQKVHQVLRPDIAFLPNGPRCQFVAGPFPWGSDRNAINKALKQSGWNVKALQPTQPVPGLGSMWIIQSVDPPPQLIFQMSHGEVVVSKHKQSEGGKPQVSPTVGSASTLTLCSHGVKDAANEVDPWLSSDPWGHYNKGKQPHQPTPAHAGLQQLEERIQTAVLSKLPNSMERDDVPDRLVTLENQAQMLMSKNQSLECQFTEFSQQSTQQFAVVQQQIQQQGQTFHGQLEHQTQSVQAMFESQMHQIRNLLSKRPRDEDGME